MLLIIWCNYCCNGRYCFYDNVLLIIYELWLYYHYFYHYYYVRIAIIPIFVTLIELELRTIYHLRMSIFFSINNIIEYCKPCKWNEINRFTWISVGDLEDITGPFPVPKGRLGMTGIPVAHFRPGRGGFSTNR